MVFKDTELDTQGSDKQQSLDERQKQWMGWDSRRKWLEKKQRLAEKLLTMSLR